MKTWGDVFNHHKSKGCDPSDAAYRADQWEARQQSPATMTDAELADYLHLTSEEAAIVIPKLSPAKRAVYDRMKQVEIESALWSEGLGPKPRGVLIDTERSTKRRRGWR